MTSVDMKKGVVSAPTKKITEKGLAIFLHETYEELAKDVGWKTQESCRVYFDDLPVDNKQVMLRLSGRLLNYFGVGKSTEIASRKEGE